MSHRSSYLHGCAVLGSLPTRVSGDDWQAQIMGYEAQIFGADPAWQAQITGDDWQADILGEYRDASTVLSVQSALAARGYKNQSDGKPLSVDGLYGPNTAAAIRNVQLQTGDPQTGLIDDALLLKLGLNLPSQKPAPSPGQAAAQAAIDQILPTVRAAITPGGGQIQPPPSFLEKPISEGSNVKVYQAGLIGIGLAAILTGLVMGLRRR